MTKVYVVGTWYDYNHYSIHSIWATESQAEKQRQLLLTKPGARFEDVDIEEYEVNEVEC